MIDTADSKADEASEQIIYLRGVLFILVAGLFYLGTSKFAPFKNNAVIHIIISIVLSGFVLILVPNQFLTALALVQVVSHSA